MTSKKHQALVENRVFINWPTRRSSLLVWNQPFFGGIWQQICGSRSQESTTIPGRWFLPPKRSFKKNTEIGKKNDDMGTNSNTLWTNEGLEVLLLIRHFVNFCIKPGTKSLNHWGIGNLLGFRSHPSTVAPPSFQHHGHLVDGTGVGLRQWSTHTVFNGGLPSGKLAVCYWKLPFTADIPIKYGEFQ